MRRRDLLRGLFVAAVACPALASSLARANPRPKPKPRPRPHSQLHPVAPRAFMPPDGLPLVVLRQTEAVVDVMLSNPHGRPIFFEAVTAAVVTHGIVTIDTRVHNWSPTGFYVYTGTFVHARRDITVRTMVDEDVAETVAVLLPPIGENIHIPAALRSVYHIVGIDTWFRGEAPCQR